MSINYTSFVKAWLFQLENILNTQNIGRRSTTDTCNDMRVLNLAVSYLWSNSFAICGGYKLYAQPRFTCAVETKSTKCQRDYSNSSCSVVALITCLTTLSTLCRVGLSSNVSRKDFPSSSLLDTRGSSGIDPAKARCVWKLNGKSALHDEYYATLWIHIRVMTTVLPDLVMTPFYRGYNCALGQCCTYIETCW